MVKTLIVERRLLPNHDADPTQTILCDLAAALHGIAAQNMLEALGDTSGLPLEQRKALCLVATGELLHHLQASLTAAPQGPLTEEIVFRSCLCYLLFFIDGYSFTKTMVVSSIIFGAGK